jgi:hypothetical protein
MKSRGYLLTAVFCPLSLFSLRRRYRRTARATPPLPRRPSAGAAPSPAAPSPPRRGGSQARLLPGRLLPRRHADRSLAAPLPARSSRRSATTPELSLAAPL